jgi:hypothetical protein
MLPRFSASKSEVWDETWFFQLQSLYHEYCRPLLRRCVSLRLLSRITSQFVLQPTAAAVSTEASASQPVAAAAGGRAHTGDNIWQDF